MRVCLDHRPKVVDDDGKTVVIKCANCGYTLVSAVPR